LQDSYDSPLSLLSPPFFTLNHRPHSRPPPPAPAPQPRLLGPCHLVTYRDELFFYGKMMIKTRDCHGATPSGQMMGELGDYPTDNSSQISSQLELFKSHESKWNLFGTRSLKSWWVLDEQNLPRLEIRGFIWLWVKTLIPLVPKKSWLMDGYASKNGNHRF
jgi:hypothetical protein